MDNVLKKPVISEKSMKLAAGGLYTFLVDKKAAKPEIVKAVQERFSVNVVSVKTANFKAERKMQRGRKGYFTVAGFKKALVSLKNGQKIAYFETEEKKPEAKEEVKEKKSLLKGTKVKIEKIEDKKKEGKK